MNLKSKTFSAGRWTSASAVLRSVLQLLQISILARLLSPADFGVMAVAGSLLTLVNLFSDLGLSRAIIHFRTISVDDLASLFWLNLLAGLVLSIGFAASAPMLGDIFKLHGLTAVLLATSPVFVLSAFGQQFRALAEKDFRFSTLSIIEIVSAASGVVAAIGIALMGGGIYALVGAILVAASANSALAFWQLSKGYRPRWHLRPTEVRRFLQFGGYLIGENLLNTLISQSDIFVGGLFATPIALGFYSVPRDLSLRVGMVVNPIITRVGFPVMASLQTDSSALKSVYMQTLRMTASVNCPAYIALALFADEVVALLYGHQWKHAATYLRILALWGLINSIGNPVGSLLHAVGAVKRAFWWNAALLLVIPPLLWITTRDWGLPGLAAALVIIYLALMLPAWWILVYPYCGATVLEYLRQIVTPLILSTITGLSAWLITRDVPHGTLRLALGAIIGSVIYLGLSRAFNRLWFNAMWTLLHLPTHAKST